MQLFFHDVGLEGSENDFPKTIYSSIHIESIKEALPAYRVDELYSIFPSGFFNAWGVPSGAKPVIKRLAKGDVMLLIRTTSGAGDIPILCQIKAFWSELNLELSELLWENNRFPYVFFFETAYIDLSWEQLKADIGYKPNFRPSGHVYRINEDKLLRVEGAEKYVASLLKKEYRASEPDANSYEEQDGLSNLIQEPVVLSYAANNQDRNERLQILRMRAVAKSSSKSTSRQRTQNIYDRAVAVKQYVLERANGLCEGCGAAAPFLTKEKKPYLEPHHTTRVSDGGPDHPEHVIALCPNCHRRTHLAVDNKDYNEQLKAKLKLIEQSIMD
jgi:hypothetical protein